MLEFASAGASHLKSASRVAIALAAVMTAATLTACGGGGSDGGSDVAFDVSVVVPGQTLSPVFAGDTVNVSILAGQSIELDASEPAIWNFTVNDSPLFGSGTTVVVGGLSIVQSDLTPSRVVIDTALIGPTVLPIFINLSATSTFDAAEVANVTLEIQ